MRLSQIRIDLESPSPRQGRKLVLADAPFESYCQLSLSTLSSVIEKHKLDLQQTGLVDEEERSEAEFVGAMETRAHTLHVDYMYVHDVNLAVSLISVYDYKCLS